MQLYVMVRNLFIKSQTNPTVFSLDDTSKDNMKCSDKLSGLSQVLIYGFNYKTAWGKMCVGR